MPGTRYSAEHRERDEAMHMVADRRSRLDQRLRGNQTVVRADPADGIVDHLHARHVLDSLPAKEAWVVQQNPDGTITVEVSDYRDPAGLQAALIAAGLDARVQTVLSDNCFGLNSRLNFPNPDRDTGWIFISPWNPDLYGRYTHGDTRMLLGPDPASAKPSMRIDPAKQRPGDLVWIGFPPDGHPLVGNGMSIVFTAPGQAPPPACFDFSR